MHFLEKTVKKWYYYFLLKTKSTKKGLIYMNPFHDMQVEIQEFFHSSKKTKIAMWIIVALFPLYLTYACNSLAFNSNELLTTLMQDNTGAFLLGAVVVYLVFGIFACLTKRIPLAAFLSALIWVPKFERCSCPSRDACWWMRTTARSSCGCWLTLPRMR